MTLYNYKSINWTPDFFHVSQKIHRYPLSVQRSKPGYYIALTDFEYNSLRGEVEGEISEASDI